MAGSEGETHAFTVNGFNALKKTNVVYANSTSRIENAINWEVLVPAFILSGAALYIITDGKGGGGDEACPAFTVAECFSSF